ncbi:LysM peptidoglycan-binding domain-containing protein [Angustibacter sp. Root456]|uniref:LysM peptidoglycan-binding domain-containing protein n=1 Tax=Angustibacter sp. Root456 TaxID=1736539 RepID=UPI0009EB9FBD|nr:LysM peptidoglycan-binding domain-containing protein [Angustibacter sp. Root456]
MTAITFSAPVSNPRRRPARTAVVAVPDTRAGRARRQGAPLRLTRRGRLVVTGLLATAGVAVSLFAGGVAGAGTDAQRVPVRYVTVAPGDTLWSIAGEVAPSEDRRDTVARILELNARDTSGVRAGDRIAVPAR